MIPCVKFYYQLEYFTGEFEVAQLIILALLVSVTSLLPPVCWSTFWKSSLKNLALQVWHSWKRFLHCFLFCLYTFTYILIYRDKRIPRFLFAYVHVSNRALLLHRLSLAFFYMRNSGTDTLGSYFALISIYSQPIIKGLCSGNAWFKSSQRERWICVMGITTITVCLALLVSIVHM